MFSHVLYAVEVLRKLRELWWGTLTMATTVSPAVPSHSSLVWKCSIPATTGTAEEEGENNKCHWKGREMKERGVKGLKWDYLRDQDRHCPFQLNVKELCPLDITKVQLLKQPTGWTHFLSSCVSNPICCHRNWSSSAMLLIIMFNNNVFIVLCFGCRHRWYHPLRWGKLAPTGTILKNLYFLGVSFWLKGN